MQTALVTGGAGFIGSHLVTALCADGWGVRVLDDLSSGKLANLADVREQIEFIRGCVTDAARVRRAAAGADVVFHLAAVPSVAASIKEPARTHEACVTGTLVVLQTARECGVRRLVFASSSSVYGDQPGDVKREDCLPAPISPYGAAKLAGEQYCRAFWKTYGLETVSLRYFNVFGPRQGCQNAYAAVVPNFITAMLAGRRPQVFGDGRQTRDFTYVANVIQATLLAAESPSAVGMTLNCESGQAATVNRLVQILNEILESDLGPIHSAQRPGDILHSRADIQLCGNVLGYEPRIGFEEGLRKTVAWFRSRRSNEEADSVEPHVPSPIHTWPWKPMKIGPRRTTFVYDPDTYKLLYVINHDEEDKKTQDFEEDNQIKRVTRTYDDLGRLILEDRPW